MRFGWILALGFTVTPLVQAGEVTVLTASATSSTADSVDVICLLDDKCKGSWQPASQDEGVDEGLYIQFDEPVAVYSIHVKVRESAENKRPGFQLYLNGKTTSPDDVVYMVRREIDDKEGVVNYIFKGRDEARYQNSLQTDAKSVFIKIGKSYESGAEKPVIQAVKLYRRVSTAKKEEVKLEDVAFKLPVVAHAKIKASSILKPETAYQPANMFDSKYDFAWSTNGKVTSGVNESFELNFSSKQTFSGLFVWNGYQRSKTHFSKNGRVKSMSISADGGPAQQVSLASVQGVQKVLLKKPLSNISRLKFTINDVYPGSKYKDVLISEMRLLGGDGKMILPVVESDAVKIPGRLKGFMGSSWSGFLHDITDGNAECEVTCYNKRIRLRTNGSFVIYQGFEYGTSSDGSISANVLEGNWVEEKNKLRIFGKRYTTALRSSDYIKGVKTNKVPTAKIFQSHVTLKRYSELSKGEKNQLFAYLIKNRGLPKNKSNVLKWTILFGKWGEHSISGDDANGLKKSLAVFFEKVNPYYIKSSVMTDVLLPTTNVQECSSGC